MSERKSIPTGEVLVICQKWEEVEVGWGSRPDGFSLHVSLESLRKLVRENRKRREEYSDEFSHPDSDHYKTSVDDETFAFLVENGGGYWYGVDYKYPPGATGGWRNQD